MYNDIFRHIITASSDGIELKTVNDYCRLVAYWGQYQQKCSTSRYFRYKGWDPKLIFNVTHNPLRMVGRTFRGEGLLFGEVAMVRSMLPRSG